MGRTDNAKYLTNVRDLVIDRYLSNQASLLIRISFGPNHKAAHRAQQQKAFLQGFILQDVIQGVAVEKNYMLWLLERFLSSSSLSAHC